MSKDHQILADILEKHTFALFEFTQIRNIELLQPMWTDIRVVWDYANLSKIFGDFHLIAAINNCPGLDSTLKRKAIQEVARMLTDKKYWDKVRTTSNSITWSLTELDWHDWALIWCRVKPKPIHYSGDHSHYLKIYL